MPMVSASLTSNGKASRNAEAPILNVESRLHGSSRLNARFRLGRTFLLAALACTLASETSASDKLSSQQVAEIRQLSAEVLSKEGLPGLSVAKDDQVWSAGFGRADLEQNVAVDSRSLFRTASISKWLTATAALRLV